LGRVSEKNNRDSKGFEMKVMFKNIKDDLLFLKKRYNVSFGMAILSNRGFHSLLFYRLSNFFYRYKIPLLPLILTRIIQIIYRVDIDYKATIEGGVIIIHGDGIVIGRGALIKSGTIIYHQVTIGIKGYGQDDGFAIIGQNCILGAGCKIFGKIIIGKNSIIGANTVVTKSIPNNSIVKNNCNLIIKEKKL
jgi:serine O-acetyltransferase